MATAEAPTSRAQGNAAFRMGDLAAALDHYERAIEEDSTDALSANNASACHLKLEQWAEARHFADIAIERDPKNAKALVRRAQANVALHQSGRAVRDYRAAILLLPSHPSARTELNHVLIARSKRAKSDRLTKLRILTELNLGRIHAGNPPPAEQLREEEAETDELAATPEGRELLRAFRRDLERKLGVRSETAEDTGSSGESDDDESDEEEDEAAEAEGSDAEWETDEES